MLEGSTVGQQFIDQLQKELHKEEVKPVTLEEIRQVIREELQTALAGYKLSRALEELTRPITPCSSEQAFLQRCKRLANFIRWRALRVK